MFTIQGNNKMSLHMVYSKRLNDKTNLSCYRKQYAVGQGGLHYGVITFSGYKDQIDSKCIYIYDCGCIGGKKVIQKHIDEIVDNIQNFKNKSDIIRIFIFISHMHNDHMNGLSYLCEQLCQYNLDEKVRVILPYMDDSEKIINIGHPNLSDDDINFIIDPENFLPGKIKVLYLTDEPENGSNQYNDNYYFPKVVDNKISHHDNFIFLPKYPAVTWILSPFYNRIQGENLSKIKADLKAANITAKNCRSKKNLKKIKNLYKKYKIDINVSSLCLYSGGQILQENKPNGWVHTGDIHFYKHNTKEKFLNYYKNEFDNIKYIQIPHHGSKKNSRLADFTKHINYEELFVTTQNKTNGKTYPHLSKEYDNIAIKLTETANSIETNDILETVPLREMFS